ncbi:siderophore biosynthesis protein PvsA [Pectobacteriaceae bacterium CE70]|nr:siderophore biosynthesis protein PvsA [Pectobacteriaceae bacterium C52]WJV66138.1 siderophore biosynthesis protein PvsA [Pectobacteriaceae bacterium CE70]WJY10151.1 siderophore biosynthesis protein PvsA [Pectobacteriaceae bacterium C80]
MLCKSPYLIVSHVVNAAVIEGFIPAAQQLGYPVVLVTDQYRAHNQMLEGQVQILECDVFNPLAILDALTEEGMTPAAVFSNSDHLQTSTAIVASALGLPAKNWPICYVAKDKWRMRQRLASLSLPSAWSAQLLPTDTPDPTWPWPLVIKPSQGVASMDVSLIRDCDMLNQHLAVLPLRQTWLLEQFLQGPLFTLETFGDGHELAALGGFDVELSAPPHFVEMQARWEGEHTVRWRDQALEQLRQFGVGFGVCHSEFIATENGPVLVEINYRSIGDGREFLLDRILPGGWFTPILQLHLGQPIPTIKPAQLQALIHYLVAERSGLLSAAPQPAKLPGLHYRRLKEQGEPIALSHSNKDYLGVLYLEAPDVDQLQRLTQKALASLHWEIA